MFCDKSPDKIVGGLNQPVDIIKKEKYFKNFVLK